MSNLIYLVMLLCSVSTLFADMSLPERNKGPAYLYPTNAADRAYKLPWAAGKSFRVTGGYGNDPLTNAYRHPDYSVDFNMPEGEPIYAARGGTIIGTYNTNDLCNVSGSVGNWVKILNRDSVPDSATATGWRKISVVDQYYHVQKNIPVKSGQKVVQGELIAYASCTGQDGGGPHLHFRTYIDSIPGIWRHVGWYDPNPNYKFSSIPTPFVEITNREFGLPHINDTYISQNQIVSVESVNNLRKQTEPIEILTNPNPFYSNVMLTVQTLSPVELAIFNSAGKLVANLTKRLKNSNGRGVTWDATGQPAGVYICVAKTDMHTKSIRLVFAR
ncbi:MAG: peptidoglycan DD-metalloendopeptidase family protein [Fibrobacteres bacterium]|nr:peptidoglycan DD-metalloendopeptidase family protein [Fibrobacterota bacterium]